MSLVTIERSSSSDSLSQISGELAVESEEDEIDAELSEDVFTRPRASSSVEGFFASKGAAYAIPDGDFARKASSKGGEIQSHLQGMVNLIRDEDTMRLVVKVESEAKYTRYLSVVTAYGLSDDEESVVLGFDWIEDVVTLGLVIPLWSDVSTTLDGDGGFQIKTEHRSYIFKPVSVQTLWTALLWIHKCLSTAHRAKHFDGGLSHAWLDYYQSKISSPIECIHFWHSLGELETKRDISFSCFDKVKTDEELLKGSIRNKLKEILTRFDLEEVTCRQVREALEAEMKMSLSHLKGYVEEQLFVILGQMESSSKINDYLYLGSEWNACNLEELKDNNVGYILNVTKEVDNFFLGTFEYMNVRVYDLKEADLLRHWGKTYRFLHKAKERGSSALVHCRRGISRSASTVIAFLMKENNMSLADAMKHVKSKRSIVQPNSGFWKQLIIYEGILKSSRNRHNSLFRMRSNSDTGHVGRQHHKKGRHNGDVADSRLEHAHTIPRMACEVPVEECTGVQSLGIAGHLNGEEGILDSNSSNEDVSSNSNSDDDHSLNSELKFLRRSVSEPVMVHGSDVTMMSPNRKPRARTFSQRQAVDDVGSPARIREDLALENSGIWMQAEKSGEVSGVETSESTSECLNAVSISGLEPEKMPPDISEEDVCKPREDDSIVHSTSIIGDVVNPDEADPIELSGDAKEILCEKSTHLDNCVGQRRDNLDAPRDVLISPREDVDSSRRDTPCGDSPREGILRPRTFRQRSRSLGEKLESKLLSKQGHWESADNLKKVKLRGRVKKRDRKAKSDLQISTSGFVKKHTQIIEQEMLYSVLKNSDDTLATLNVDFWDGNFGSNVCMQNSKCSLNNLDSGKPAEPSSTVAERNLRGEVLNDYGNDHDISEEEKVRVESTECRSSDRQQNPRKNVAVVSKKEFDLNCRQVSQANLGSNSGDFSGKCPFPGLEHIVQEVNAEAKHDIATQSETTRAAVVSQDELPPTRTVDDITIDPMTWIDLTQHHGDVVKRRSAAFENKGKTQSAEGLRDNSIQSDENSSQPRENLAQSLANPPQLLGNFEVSRDNLPSSRDVLPQSRDTCAQSCDDFQQPRDNFENSPDNHENFSCQRNGDIPKLDLGRVVGESSTQQSHSITVEDYNSWEASSVRDRTKILEGIIVKHGGSFPSPRSKMMKQNKTSNSEDETRVEQTMDKLNIDTSFEPEQAHVEDGESACPVETRSDEDSVFVEAPVRILVDKFEDWGL